MSKQPKEHVTTRWRHRTSKQPIEILWLDATSVSGDEWIEWTEAKHSKPAPTLTVGYVIADTADHITVAATVNDHHIGHGITIPKGMVKEVRILQ